MKQGAEAEKSRGGLKVQGSRKCPLKVTQVQTMGRARMQGDVGGADFRKRGVTQTTSVPEKRLEEWLRLPHAGPCSLVRTVAGFRGHENPLKGFMQMA